MVIILLYGKDTTKLEDVFFILLLNEMKNRSKKKTRHVEVLIVWNRSMDKRHNRSNLRFKSKSKFVKSKGCYYCRKVWSFKRDYHKWIEDQEKINDQLVDQANITNYDKEENFILLVTTTIDRYYDAWIIDFEYSYHMYLHKD